MQWLDSRSVKFGALTFSRDPHRSDCLLEAFFEKQSKNLKDVNEVHKVGSGAAAAMQRADRIYENVHTLALHVMDPSLVVQLLKKCPNQVTITIHSTHRQHSTVPGSYFVGARCPKVTSVTLRGRFHEDNLIAIKR